MQAMLDRQSALFEHRLAPKRPWTNSKMSPGTLDRMMRQIVPCRLTVTATDGTWKLSQNKPDAVRLRAADALEAAASLAPDAAALAALMRAPPQA